MAFSVPAAVANSRRVESCEDMANDLAPGGDGRKRPYPPGAREKRAESAEQTGKAAAEVGRKLATVRVERILQPGRKSRILRLLHEGGPAGLAGTGALAGELVRNAVFMLRLTLLVAVRAATWCESANLNGELIIVRYTHRHARSTL